MLGALGHSTDPGARIPDSATARRNTARECVACRYATVHLAHGVWHAGASHDLPADIVFITGYCDFPVVV